MYFILFDNQKIVSYNLKCLPLEILPKLVIDDNLSGYHGLVKENETLVEVVPEIYAIGDVCNFNIVNKHHGEAPFEVC